MWHNKVTVYGRTYARMPVGQPIRTACSPIRAPIRVPVRTYMIYAMHLLALLAAYVQFLYLPRA